MSNGLVVFECRHCDSVLEIQKEYRGQMTECPVCKSATRVPRKKRSRSRQLTAYSDDPTVPVGMGIAGGPGFKGQVSRSDAGKMGFTFLGALVAIICVIFGVKMSNRS